jgi:enoyl-CoA hydratase
MSHLCFDVSIEDAIAHVVLSRPEKRNSMVPEFWEELPAIVSDIDQNARARVIVISSTGPHFTAGLDVSSFSGESLLPGSTNDPELARMQRGAQLYATITRLQKTFTALEACRLPVLVAIQGGCIGGGVDLITACDMRYATEDAFITIFETNIGMTADVGTFPRISKLIPDGLARELAFTGRRMPAQEAAAIGLVNRVFPSHDEMLKGVMEVAQDIAAKAPLTLYGVKRMMNHARDHSTADSLDYIATWNASMLHLEEIGEAMAANAEQRPGKFAPLPRTVKSAH